MTTSADIVNEALQYVGGNQPLVTGSPPTFDGSTAGLAAGLVYNGVVAAVGREFGFDFARRTATLALTGNVAPLGWSFEYAYPTNGLEVWQIVPATVSDASNPLPTRWAVGNTQVAAVQTKVIWTNTANARVTYNNNPSENMWDALFRQSVVRLLASVLAAAIAGKTDLISPYLESGAAFESINEGRMG